MKRLVNNVRILDHLADGTLYVLLALLLLPWLCLMGFGFYAVYKLGYIFHFTALLCTCTALVTVPYFIWRKRRAYTDQALIAQDLVSASPEWSEFDNKAWESLSPHIDNFLLENDEWTELKAHGLAIIEKTAEHYHPQRRRNTLAFSIPELLLMIELISRRYRHLIKDHLPFAEQLHLSTLQMGYEHKDKVELARKGWDVYRLLRSTTPIGILTELRNQLLGKLFGNVSEKLQYKLKYAFLQEVLRVAIDLYSGRFKADLGELEASQQTAENDKQYQAIPLEPLRICIIGQINAGKSSLVNALTGNMQAEISQLPCTEQQTIYQCQLDGIDVVKLIDMPGLDGNHTTTQQYLSEIANSDLVLWVLKANQPARGLDTILKQQIDEFYQHSANRAKKRPPIIGILSHVDRLPPTAEWLPPYDLSDNAVAKVKTINDAVAYNQDLLNLDQLIPVSVSQTHAWFNMEALQTVIIAEIEQGIQVQLNRRRLDTDSNISTTEQARRLYRLGHTLFQRMNTK